MFLTSLFGKLTDDVTKRIDDNAKKPRTVVVKQDPERYSVTEIDDVATDSTKWNTKDNPNLEFENPLEKQSIVKEISIIPDKKFKRKGKILITIDDAPVFKSRSFTAFSNIESSNVKINKTISQDSGVKVFIISEDETPVGVSVQVTFGE